MSRRHGLLLAAALVGALPITGSAAENAAPPPGTSSRIDAIRQRGTLRVAVFDEYPWLKQTTDGQGAIYRGPAWRLAEEYAARLGVRLETVQVHQDNKVQILSTGLVDISIAPMLETPERARLADLIPYSVSAQCLFGLADNPKVMRANSIDDLNRPDITFAYITDTPQGAWLQGRLPDAASHGILGHPGSTADIPVAEILSRRADVTSIDEFFFAGLAKTVPGLVSVPKGDACLASKELPIPIVMAIEKNQPEFLAWLQAIAVAIHSQVEAAEAQVAKAGI